MGYGYRVHWLKPNRYARCVMCMHSIHRQTHRAHKSTPLSTRNDQNQMKQMTKTSRKIMKETKTLKKRRRRRKNAEKNSSEDKTEKKTKKMNTFDGRELAAGCCCYRCCANVIDQSTQIDMDLINFFLLFLLVFVLQFRHFHHRMELNHDSSCRAATSLW